MTERNEKNSAQETPKRSAPLGSPQDTYLGIYDSAEDVRALLGDLKGHGIGPERLTVYVGPQDAEAFVGCSVEQMPGGSTGLALRKIFAPDEVEREAVYRESVREGSYVVQVQAPEEDEKVREAVEAAMLERGGRYISYFGRLTFETVMAE